MEDDKTNPKDLLGVKKPRLSLVPASSVIYQALAMENGAAKYGAYNWRDKDIKASIYVEACKRHLDSWFDSQEELAPDSKVPHLAHAIACIGILIDAVENKNLSDDRPKKGPAAGLIEKYTKKNSQQEINITSIKKYELTTETKVWYGVTLYRIRALKDFDIIKAGGLGGWVEKEENLSQGGNAWVFGNAWVYGNALVSGNAWVSGNAKVSGDAHVYGNALVSGDATVSGDAKVSSGYHNS